jgi:hypothetical protein
MDGTGFLSKATGYLDPIAPIMSFAIKKQLSDLNATPETLTPETARQFIDRMVTVLRTFAPPDKVEEVRQALLREFRKAAPGYAESLNIYGGK